MSSCHPSYSVTSTASPLETILTAIAKVDAEWWGEDYQGDREESDLLNDYAIAVYEGLMDAGILKPEPQPKHFADPLRDSDDW